MRVKTVILESFEDENTGEIGLGLKRMPRDETTNAAWDGLTVAHDILEHVNGPEHIGSISDELEALGAIWYVRGQHGDMRRDGFGSRYSPEQNVASDITRMFRDFYCGAYLDMNVPRTLACDADDSFDIILNHAFEDAWKEFDSTDDDEIKVKEALRPYLKVCRAKMRIGYRKAVRKYERHGRWFANSLFWEIAETVKPHIKHLDIGQQFRLRYGLKDGGVYASMREIDLYEQ